MNEEMIMNEENITEAAEHISEAAGECGSNHAIIFAAGALIGVLGWTLGKKVKDLAKKPIGKIKDGLKAKKAAKKDGDEDVEPADFEEVVENEEE